MQSWALCFKTYWWVVLSKNKAMIVALVTSTQSTALHPCWWYSPPSHTNFPSSNPRHSSHISTREWCVKRVGEVLRHMLSLLSTAAWDFPWFHPFCYVLWRAQSGRTASVVEFAHNHNLMKLLWHAVMVMQFPRIELAGTNTMQNREVFAKSRFRLPTSLINTNR